MSTETETQEQDSNDDDDIDQKDSLNDNASALNPTQLLDLNDDCLIAILKELPTNFDFHSIASTCIRLGSLARIAFKSRESCKVLHIEEMIHKYKPNEIEEIQRYLTNFGASITDIRFSLVRLWNKDVTYNTTSVRNQAIFDAIVEFCGDTLEKLDMTNILMELAPLPANTYYFQNLTNFTISGCYDCSLNSGNHEQFLSQYYGSTNFSASFLKLVPNPIKLLELFIYNCKLNNDALLAISKCVELKTFELYYCSRIATDNVHLLNNLTKVTKLLLYSGNYSYDGTLILQNIGSIDSLERLTLRCLLIEPDEFLAALKRFNNLQFVHFGFVCDFETSYFNQLHNFRSVREFSLDSWAARCVSMKDLVAIVMVMTNLEKLVILSGIGDGEDDEDQLCNETYLKLVNICRRADRKLILKVPGFDNEGGLYDIDFDQETYAINKKYVEFQELDDDDFFN